MLVTAAPATDSPRPTPGVWIGLGLVVTIALALRLGTVLSSPRPDGFRGIDPDGYGQTASSLVTKQHTWRWTPRVTKFGEFTKAPLYPVLLSFFALASPSWYPLSAAIGQAIAGGLTVFVAFWLGRTIHSDRAGLLAACLLAIYLPSVTRPGVFWQENFYLPCVMLALALLTRASARDAPARDWGVAGVVFGVAALIRSMPVYFLPAVAVVHVAWATKRQTATRQALALVMGAALIVVPYSVYISSTVGQPILIESIGTIRARVAYSDNSENPHGRPPLGLIEAAGMFLRTFANDPLTFMRDRLQDAKGLLQLHAGRWLQEHQAVETPGEAWRLKALAHVAYDLPFALATGLAAFGWALARRRSAATLLALWVLINIGLVTASTMVGARYRAPIELPMIVLAAAVLAGSWRPLARWSAVAALLGALVIAPALVSSAVVSLRGRADYGLRDQSPETAWHAWAAGDAGFNVLTTRGGLLEFSVAQRDNPTVTPVYLQVFVERRLVDEIALMPGQTHLVRYRHGPVQLAYVELKARPLRDGTVPDFSIALPPEPR